MTAERNTVRRAVSADFLRRIMAVCNSRWRRLPASRWRPTKHCR